MKYKAILLDIDDTLYCYEQAHKFAIKNIINYFKEKFELDEETVLLIYEKARNKVHLDLDKTAASHNRLLYFQNMCEILDINPLKFGKKLSDLYWNKFLENLKVFEGVYGLLEKYKNSICLITDLTAYIQYQKIEKLKINRFCKKIVTSEEAGVEKPHPNIFNLALQKLAMKTHDVCMIGDNFSKDIYGATSLNIDSIWFNHKNIKKNYKKNNIKEVTSFKEILNLV